MTQQKLQTIEKHYDNMFLALLPLVFCGTILYGPRVLLISATGLLTARAVDVMVSVLRKQENDSSDRTSTVAALTFCMLLPVSIPLYVVIMTVGIVTLIGKHVFGGKDAYPFSLAALSMCVAAVNWPNEVFKVVAPFSNVSFWSGSSSSTISGAATIKQGGLPYISTLDLFLGNYPSTIGASFILVIIATGIYLIATKRISWHVPVSFLATCCAFALLFPRIYGISRFDSFKFEILNGSIIFCAIFMLCEPATTPKNPKAKIVFGVLAGLLGMLFRYYGSYEIGICFALLLVNATEGFFDRIITKDVTFKLANKSAKAPKQTNEKAQKSLSTVIAQKKSVNLTKEENLSALQKNEKEIDLTPQVNLTETEQTNISNDAKQAVKNKREQPITEEKPKAEKINTSKNKSVETKAKVDEMKNKKSSKNSELDDVDVWYIPEPITKKSKSASKNTKANKKETPLDIISQAEDKIDQVSFSTQTIDMKQALEMFDEQNNRKAKKNNGNK